MWLIFSDFCRITKYWKSDWIELSIENVRKAPLLDIIVG